MWKSAIVVKIQYLGSLILDAIKKKKIVNILTLVMMVGKYTLVMMGRGGGLKVSPLFSICEHNRKVIRLCTVLKKMSCSFEDRAIFHVIQLSFDVGGLMCPLQIDR